MNAKIFACLMVCLVTFGLVKEEINSNKTSPKIALSATRVNNNGDEVTVCHKGELKQISLSALSGHLGHGDVLLTDEDQDGFVTARNDCGIPVDCDDNDPNRTVTCLECFASDILENLTPLEGSCMIIKSRSGTEQLKLTLITSDGTNDYTFRMLIEQITSENFQNYNLNGQYYKDGQVYTINHGRDHVDIPIKDVYTYCFGIMKPFAETHDFLTCLR